MYVSHLGTVKAHIKHMVYGNQSGEAKATFGRSGQVGYSTMQMIKLLFLENQLLVYPMI